MKTTLNLTFEEGLKIIEAMKDVATKRGWDEDELDECGVIEEYTSAVDAALTAMGISVNIASEPEVEDDNDFDNEEWDEDEEGDYFNSDDEDEEEDDDSTTYSLTAKGEFVLRYIEAGHTVKEAYEIADLLFGKGE